MNFIWVVLQNHSQVLEIATVLPFLSPAERFRPKECVVIVNQVILI